MNDRNDNQFFRGSEITIMDIRNWMNEDGYHMYPKAERNLNKYGSGCMRNGPDDAWMAKNNCDIWISDDPETAESNYSYFLKLWRCITY